MPPAANLATVRDVNDQIGSQFKARRLKLGLTITALAKHAGLTRETLSNFEKGQKVQPVTAGKVDRTLTELERRWSMDLPSRVEEARPIGDPAEGMVAFEVAGQTGVTVVVKGPVSNMAELQEAARRLAADMAQERPQGGDRP